MMRPNIHEMVWAAMLARRMAGQPRQFKVRPAAGSSTGTRRTPVAGGSKYYTAPPSVADLSGKEHDHGEEM